jgi:hypothetical protein
VLECLHFEYWEGDFFVVKRIRTGDDSTKPFNEHMTKKVFAGLGKPDAKVWPTVVDMPHWRHASAITHNAEQGELQSYERQSKELWNRIIACLDGRSQLTADRRVAADLVLKMLYYDPLERVNLTEVLEKLSFNDAALRGNVFYGMAGISHDDLTRARKQMQDEKVFREQAERRAQEEKSALLREKDDEHKKRERSSQEGLQ